MKKIIFVCTGNTCRSPMAEKILIKHLDKNKKKTIEVISRGIAVYLEGQANENAIKTMKEYEIDLAQHVSKQLSEADIDEDTLILTMTGQHKKYVKMLLNKMDNIYTLKEYANLMGDIQDPYGGDISIYRECAVELDDIIKKIVYSLL